MHIYRWRTWVNAFHSARQLSLSAAWNRRGHKCWLFILIMSLNCANRFSTEISRQNRDKSYEQRNALHFAKLLRRNSTQNCVFFFPHSSNTMNQTQRMIIDRPVCDGDGNRGTVAYFTCFTGIFSVLIQSNAILQLDTLWCRPVTRLNHLERVSKLNLATRLCLHCYFANLIICWHNLLFLTLILLQTFFSLRIIRSAN